MSSALVTINGNITADPELRHTATGLEVINFTVAHTARRREDSGEWVDNGPALFVKVTAWRKLAANIAESLKKGQAVVVIGSLRNRAYEHNGESRSEIVCDADIVAIDLRRATAVVSRNVAPADSAPPATRRAAA